ncbi:hypothetical protein ACLQ24_25655 [Micromonospora sp. DT4]|uniref:hypothetical protein n=1 Tax=Micromonospora sp. DT4 TaxID=3393438 RepID=UPI003CEC3D19
MAFPRKYPAELIDAAVQRVADTRAVKAYGAVTAVARQLHLDPRLVQKWVNKATTPDSPASPPADGSASHLSPGLLRCVFCGQPMNHSDLAGAGQGYECGPGCRPRPLKADAVADAVGRAILRHAARIVPAAGAPASPQLAAVHAHRVLARVTVGVTARDITLTWRPAPALPPEQRDRQLTRHVTAARAVALRDPLRACQLLRDGLRGVDPATAPADPANAHAATLLAELHLRLGRPAEASLWAAYAHHSTAHLHGPTEPRGLDALHLLALAHRRAGHPQRAHHLYRQLADRLTAVEGPHAHRTLAAHAGTALVLHDLGHCHAARVLLADTIATHRRHHPGHPAAGRMTQHLTRIWDDCAGRGHHHDQDS